MNAAERFVGDRLAVSIRELGAALGRGHSFVYAAIARGELRKAGPGRVTSDSVLEFYRRFEGGAADAVTHQTSAPARTGTTTWPRSAARAGAPLLLLAALLSAAGCVPSPTEPAEARFAVEARPETCSFLVVASQPVVADWRIKAGPQLYSGQMTTPRLVLGVASFAGDVRLEIDYHGRRTDAAITCAQGVKP